MKRILFLLSLSFASQASAAWTGPAFEQGPLLKILVSDWDSRSVLAFAPDGTLLGEFGDTGSREGNPTQMLRDSAGRIYIAYWGGAGQILRYDRDGTFLDVFATVDNFEGFAFDSEENLYIATHGGSDALRKYTPGGNMLWETRIWQTNGVVFGDVGMPAVGPNGLIYLPVTDFFEQPIHDAVWRFTSDGNFLDVFGEASNSGSGINLPGGVAIDPAGNVYVSSSSDFSPRNHRFRPDGTFDGFEAGRIWGNLVFDRDGGLWGTDGSEDAVVRYDRDLNYLSTLIDAGRGGLPDNFRPEGITLIYAIPEPSVAALVTIMFAIGTAGRWRG